MNERPSRADVLMEQAFSQARRSTCSRLHVGAIIALEGRHITSGYNGTPAGLPHCQHGGGPNDRCDGGAIHAEKNAIAFAARYGGHGTDGAELFVTHSPCRECAQLIIQAGIICVHYAIAFRQTDGIELLEDAGIEVIHHAIASDGTAYSAGH